MNDIPQRRVVCAIAQHRSGVILCSPRHFDSTAYQLIDAIGFAEGWHDANQGFVDQWGVFMTREEAHVVATEANQIIRRCGGDGVLYSENLY